MAHFGALCLYFLTLLIPAVRSGSGGTAEDIDVLVFLPQNNSYLFSRARVAPAIFYAQRALAADAGPYSGFHFNIHFENSDCVNGAVLKLVDRSCGHKPDLILGPVCEYEAAPVVRLASHWNIPVISAGALALGFHAKKGEFSHLTRIAPSYEKMAETFVAMFEHFAWGSALLLYEDDKAERNCYFTIEGVFNLFGHFNIRTYSFSVEEHLDTESILESMNDIEVVIMCLGADGIREVMLAAHRRGLTNGSYMFFNVELFNASSYGNGTWKRGDKYDNDARQAYASLNTLTLLRSIKPEFENFTMEMRQSSEKPELSNCKDCESVNMFVEGFHDAMLLYAIALHEAMKSGYSKKNGTAITSRMWNRTFEGIAGQVSIDINGDRNGDFSLMSMTDVEAGTYEMVANYYAENKSFVKLPAFNDEHFTLKGSPISQPEMTDKSCGLGVSALTGVIVGAVLGTAMLIGFYFFRKNYRITVERRSRIEESNTGKHRQLREDSIRSNFSAA
ncbi:atrial natriuretic peptide receptor 3-like [Cynoglossus semilaevis]|uniref:Natriuretic peptide receptor 3 n=1 Tax=Cynoglossus semilaevis TaxID=244447 RepID=A0A3P8VIX0_CYNSE|nr:atrial natriuretic peptide receptor 3-like [Cynoglossus semilaevis]